MTLGRAAEACFEIQLERDVKLPVKYIRSALPDGGDGYAVESVYGMCGSAWTQGGVKMIHAPLKICRFRRRRMANENPLLRRRDAEHGPGPDEL